MAAALYPAEGRDLLYLLAVLDELAALSDWLLAGEGLVEDLDEEGDIEAAYRYRMMADAGRHLAALIAVLDQGGEGAARRWAASRTPGPIGAYLDWLASMAAVMRQWAPETRRRGEALVPLLPDPETRQQMREEDRLSYPLELYDAVEIFTCHVLAEAIGDLELHAAARGRVPGAGEDPDYERVWREIDPKSFEEVDR